jgi:predicted enzyme related to lactoylglutathione lyase
MQVLLNIDVPDLEAAVGFYRDALALRPGRRLFGGSVAEMLGASSTIHLLAKPPGSMATARAETARAYKRHWTPVHLDFVVDDLDESVARAVRAGAKLEGGIESFSWGRLATFSDPFGHGFCLLQLVGAGYDEAA